MLVPKPRSPYRSSEVAPLPLSTSTFPAVEERFGCPTRTCDAGLLAPGVPIGGMNVEGASASDIPSAPPWLSLVKLRVTPTAPEHEGIGATRSGRRGDERLAAPHLAAKAEQLAAE
jgi:hypothetical protein